MYVKNCDVLNDLRFIQNHDINKIFGSLEYASTEHVLSIEKTNLTKFIMQFKLRKTKNKEMVRLVMLFSLARHTFL